MDQLTNIWKNTRSKEPLIHFITNYVTANDCANMALSLGALPIMADDAQEAAKIVDGCSALLINIGTLNDRTVEAMLAAGKRANRQNKPILLDPVGVGVTKYRDETITMLMRELDFAVIKGNISEIKFLSAGISCGNGVDAGSDDLVNEQNLPENIALVKHLSLMAGCVVVATGPIDLVAGKKEVYAIRNGTPMMASVTGTGCMAGSVIASLVGGNPTQALEASVAAVGSMGICGELAAERLQTMDGGINTFRTLIIDFMGKIDAPTFVQHANIECVFSS